MNLIHGIMNVRKSLNLSRSAFSINLSWYLSIIRDAVGSMLAQEDDDKNERAVYYLSKKFLDYETRYTPIKKVVLRSRMGHAEIKAHYPTLLDMDSC